MLTADGGSERGEGDRKLAGRVVQRILSSAHSMNDESRLAASQAAKAGAACLQAELETGRANHLTRPAWRLRIRG